MAGIAMRSGSGRRGGNGMIMLAALACGLLTAGLVVVFLRNENEKRRNSTDATIAVVVAKEEIPLAAEITSGMLEVRQVTPDTAVANAYNGTGLVTGKRARYPIAAGAQIVPAMIVEGVDRAALSYVVPPGKRAMAISGSDVIGGGGHIRPGDFVDVIVSIEAWKLGSGTPTSGADKPKGAATILQGVEVLAVADDAAKLADTGPDAKTAKDARPAGNERNQSVTLAVDPAQAQLLFLAETEGKIRLALRPFGERGAQPVAPVMEPLAIPVPAGTR